MIARFINPSGYRSPRPNIVEQQVILCGGNIGPAFGKRAFFVAVQGAVIAGFINPSGSRRSGRSVVEQKMVHHWNFSLSYKIAPSNSELTHIYYDERLLAIWLPTQYRAASRASLCRRGYAG